MAGWLPLYMMQEDVPLLHERLNSDPEIAFIIRDGPDRWRAVRQVDDIRGKMKLWHILGGPLYLLHYQGEDTVIEDPFAGWKEERPGLDNTVPYFGPSCQVSMVLEVWPPGWRVLPEDYLYMSGIEWYGRSVDPPPAPTRRWWNRMRNWARRHAVLVTRWGPLDGPRPEIWAMPAALRAIQSGLERAENPFSPW